MLEEVFLLRLALSRNCYFSENLTVIWRQCGHIGPVEFRYKGYMVQRLKSLFMEIDGNLKKILIGTEKFNILKNSFFKVFWMVLDSSFSSKCSTNLHSQAVRARELKFLENV